MNLMKKLLAVGTALVMLCSLFTVAAPSAYALAGASKSGDGSIVAWGCDMSMWNVGGDTNPDYSLVDFNKMKADGCEFVILRIGDEKAGYSDRRPDGTFVTLYNMARAAGMHVGAYYYSYKTTRAGAVGDAQFCLDIIQKNDMYFDYPIYFDVEASVQESLATSTLVDLCLGWCETMVDAGYFPGVYSTASHSLDELQASSSFNYDTWVAIVKKTTSGTQYDPTTDKTSYRTKYGMWQYKWYSDSWSAPSYEGSYWYDSSAGWPLDCNVAYRDYPTIMQTYGYNNVVKKHTISFESNGGSAVADVKVKDGETLTAPTAPTRYGFDFAGWYCNPELTDPYDFSTPVPYDFTLYAKWDEAYWSANNNLMPNEQQLQLEDFNGQGQIWPYFNNDEYSSVTMYNGVENTDNWSWPTAYMTYENSFDSVNNAYVYVKKDGTAQFNATLTYLDKDGVEQSVLLSDAAGKSGDFPAGVMEDFIDVGSYIRNLGHAPASGNVKFTKVTYYVIGEKDSYVKLYDMKFTEKFDIPDPHKTVMNSDIEQLAGAGGYVYDNGTLTMEAIDADGYSLKMNVNDTINPTDMKNLLMDVSATAPFNVTLELTNAAGDAMVELRNEYFNSFGLDAVPTTLPSGTWNVAMNLLGYYEWNGGAVTESTIKSVTISLEGEGTLTLKALQVSRNDTPVYVQDGQSSLGSLNNSSLGDINGDTTVDSTDVRLLIREMVVEGSLSGMQFMLADYNVDGIVNTADARTMLLQAITL